MGVRQAAPRLRHGGRARLGDDEEVGLAARIEIFDVETGKVDIVRYVAVDDCGPAINPKLIDGQIHGGITHAIGQALYERIHYDDDGQLVTGTFVDYALPSAADVPSFETDRTETPSPVAPPSAHSLVTGSGGSRSIAIACARSRRRLQAGYARPLIRSPTAPARFSMAISCCPAASRTRATTLPSTSNPPSAGS